MFNFHEHKQVNDVWDSQTFYSEIGGYKLRLIVAANGFRASNDTHVSVGVCLMRGENDEILKWPLNSEISIQLLNWRENKGHVETIIDHYNLPLQDHIRVMDGEMAPNSRTSFTLISHMELHYNAEEYLHKDTLCFRVSKVTVHRGNKTFIINNCIIYYYSIGQDVPSWYIPTPLTEVPYLLPPCTLTMYNISEHKRVGDAWMIEPFYT